jgi:hypothetical protein
MPIGFLWRADGLEHVVHHLTNAQLPAFSDGATAAASGAIAGAVIVLGQRAIVDLSTAAIGLASVGILWQFALEQSRQDGKYEPTANS